MRYRITTFPLMHGHLVTISASPDHDDAERIRLHQFFVEYGNLKVDDLQHLLEDIWRQVGEVTP